MYALIQFIGENAHKTKALYWTEKQFGIHIRDSTSLSGPSNEDTFYDISGNEHNISYIKIPIKKTIEVNKKFSATIALSKTYPSHKPNDVILTDTSLTENTASALPFQYVTFKLYYKYL